MLLEILYLFNVKVYVSKVNLFACLFRELLQTNFTTIPTINCRYSYLVKLYNLLTLRGYLDYKHVHLHLFTYEGSKLVENFWFKYVMF